MGKNKSVQYFKSVYFSDYKEYHPKSKGLVLAFGEPDEKIYRSIAHLTSAEIRNLAGIERYRQLIRQSAEKNYTVNQFLVEKLVKRITLDSIDSQNSKINPIHVTFRGGKEHFLHNWYSYLEGYSPKFVEYILDNYAKSAKVIYDPFAGTGVTPMVAAYRGLQSPYSEVNPLLQFLVKAKVDVTSLEYGQKKKIIKSLLLIHRTIDETLYNQIKDNQLIESYNNVFEKSKYFDDKTFDLILRARTLLDIISLEDQLTSNILAVAILNSLISSSLLQRAGDLRYKNKNELKNRTDFLNCIKSNLNNIITDIELSEQLKEKPVLLTEDAKELAKITYQHIDAVITSPPYLNGTNYIRNTKLELWFLRYLNKKEDLSNFRKVVITAGINDVSASKKTEYVTKSIESTVKKVQSKAYDDRIPKMIADYFSDMKKVFQGLSKHLSKNAIIAIDIGDSIYGGVKVQTDKLLVDVLESIGYKLEKSIELRKRISRNQESLHQVLLLFSKQDVKAADKKRIDKFNWEKDWGFFKKELPHKIPPFSKRNWGHPLHSLCSYQGKMKPSLAHYLVKTFTRPGDMMLDPFAGVGTIPFEAALNGVRSYGFEISPAAYNIASAKLLRPDLNSIEDTINKVEKYINTNKVTTQELKSIVDFGFNKKLPEYFQKDTLNEILLVRRFFQKNKPTKHADFLVYSGVLHILHGNRPYALSRRSHGIIPLSPTGPFEYKSLIKSLREKINRSISTKLPSNFTEGKMLFQDATLSWPREVNDLDAIITSPPFFDSTRFYVANWLRLWFSGWEPEDFISKPKQFIDTKQKKSFDAYLPILQLSRERLRKGGVLVLHLGKSKKADMAKELIKITKNWFSSHDVFEENVEDGESHGMKDKGTVTSHQYLVLT